MSSLAADIKCCREAIQSLLTLENYDTSTFSSLWQTYQHALVRYCESSPAADADLLQSELDWVQLAITHVNSERAAISQQLMNLHQGRKAVGQYGRFPAE